MTYQPLHAPLPIDADALRACAVGTVCSMMLARRCAAGERAAIAALHAQFWPYVSVFSGIIDRHARALSVRPLFGRFGRERVRHYFANTAHELRRMRYEECEHAYLWQMSAAEAGIALSAKTPLPAVKILIERASTHDPVAFFAWLAGTEYVAEELAKFLCSQERFLACFSRHKWVWGDVHRLDHVHGPSHLQIDLDLCCAFVPETCSYKLVENAVMDCLQSFLTATDAVNAAI
jgi:hypothetical protein